MLAVVLFFTVEVSAISAENYVLMDATSGRILQEKNADRQSLIASTTKIMTALVVCQQCNVLDRVKIPKEAVGIEGSSMYLQEGEVLTVQDLLYGLMLRSGNDAAMALAIYCGGTAEGFAELMNDKARSLNLTGTHFVNPHGLDAPGHYSTARDLAVLAAYAMENPIFAQTVSTKQVTVGTRSLTNHNKLLWQLEGAEGVKTGYTKAAGRILVSSTSRQGRRLVAVTINAPSDWQDHKVLLDSGFANYTVCQIVEDGQRIATIPVAGGESGTVELLADESFSYALAKEEEPTFYVPSCGFLYAPVVEGADAGFAYVMLKDQCIGRIPLVYGSTVEMTHTEKESFWERLFGGRKQ